MKNHEMKNTMRIKEVNEYDQFLGLREEWNHVLEKSNDDEIFLTWEWLSTWWKHYGKERELLILLAEDANKIVAIAPLMYSVYRFFGLKLRKIEFIGTLHTDYSNFILTEEKAKSLKLFFKHLFNLSWDYLELKEIPETSESMFFIRKLFKESLKERVCDKCSYVNLPASWDAFSKGLSGNMRRNLRRRMRKLAEKYDVAFRRELDFYSIDECMKIFFNLHQKRWRSKGLMGSFGEEPKFQDFLLDVSKYFAERKWLNLFFLTINDKPISSALCFEYNKTLYYYHPGFDPEYSKFGVGNLLIAHIIEQYIHKGLTKFDFLKGDEPYKHDWTKKSRNNIEIRCIRNRFPLVLYDKTRSNMYAHAHLFPQKLKRTFSRRVPSI